MLDKATLEWWEDRDLCVKCEGFFHCMYRKSPYGLNVRFCRLYTPEWLPKTDYLDALEFEARVAEYLSHGSVYPISECTLGRDLEAGLHDCRPYIEHKRRCAECRLKSARIAIENQMIREGKGPGSPEDI